MNKPNILKAGLILIVAAVSFGAFAAPWVANGPKRKVTTVVVTSNYKSSRLMADLILNESYQPYILLPTPESPEQKIIYIQAKGPALEIEPGKLNHFVRLLNPQRIVLIGDERYVPCRYTDLFDRTIPVIRIEGSDWDRVAEQLRIMLNLSNLTSDFCRLREELLNQGKLFRPAPYSVQSGEEYIVTTTVEETTYYEPIEFIVEER